MINEFASLQKIIAEAITMIVVNDSTLIRKGQERAMSSRLGIYLSSFFPSWNVDCEYNRTGYEDALKRGVGGKKYYRPDVIIHKRGLPEKENNLLWIEVKLDNSATTDDTNKLKEFTTAPKGNRIIQYKYGLSVSFLPEIKLIWIENGKELD